MGKRFFSKFLLLALLLVFQLAVPLVNTFAATNNSILPPSNLASQLLTPDDVKLTWTSVYGATGYNVYEIKEGQLILLGKTTTVSYSLSNLAEGSHTYVVSTLSAEGESGPCAPVSVNIVYPNMAAPTNLTHTIQNGNDIALSWAASQYAQSYKIYQISLDGQETVLNSVYTPSYAIKDASEGQYTYAVSAVNSLYGESPLSAARQVEVIYPTMQAPGNFTYTVTNGSDVTLKWNAVSYATNYNVYQIIDGQRSLKSKTASTSIKFTSVPAGEYVYEVRSNSDRFGESAEGSQLSVIVSSVTMAAPSNFAYRLQNINDIVLSWGSVPYATNYKVYQIVDGQQVLKSTVTGTTVTYTNSPAGDYVYEVRSFSNSFGESTEGSQVSLTVTTVNMTAPSNFAYKILNGNDIVLSWGSAANANSYKVYQIVNGQKVLKSTVSGTAVTYTNLPAGDYTYEVHSFSTRFGESPEGTQLSLSVIYPTVQAPANLVQTINSATSFTLSWTASEYATSYKVYQVVNGQKTLKSTVSGTSVTYSNMVPGDYTYVVQTYSSRFGESSEGSQLTVTLNGQTMEAPANLTYSITNGNDITLKWTAVQYTTSYNIYQVVNGEKVLKKTLTGTSFTFTNLPGGDYNYVVHSSSTLLGESPVGAEVAISLVLPAMEAPGNLTQKIQNGNDVVLSWAAAAYANSYKVYEMIDGQKVLKTTVTTLYATFPKASEGEHIYVVHSYSNRFGESPAGSQVSVNVVFSIMQAPENLTYSFANGNDIVLRWNAVTYATAYNVYQIIDGQPVLKQTVTGTAVSFANLPEGEYSYEVRSFSTRFGESPSGSQISVTVVFPVMQAPANPTYSIANGNDIVLRWNAATYATAYRVYQIIDGQPVLKSTVTGTAVSFANMPEGDYSYEIRSFSSRFGESPTSSPISLTLKWPVVQPPVLSDTVFNANNITLTWKAVTWANEYRVYKITNDGRQLLYKGTALSYKVYNLTEETHSFEVTAYSTRFGESAPSNRVTENIVYPVMQPPVASLTLTSDTSARIIWNFVTYANGYNVYELIDGKPVLVAGNVNNLSYTINNLSHANHEYYVTSYSNSFGESESSNIVLAKLIVDTEPPVTTVHAPTEWTNQNPVVTLSVTDNETGVENTYYSLDDDSFVAGTSFTVTGEGVHKVSFYSVDKAGNIEPAKTIYVKIDQTAPVTKASEIPAWSAQPVTLNLTATDAQSGAAKTFYSINGSEYVEGTAFTVDQEGVNQISFYSIDKAGNAEKPQTIEVKSDKTAPVTTSNAPAAWSKEDVTVNLTATDAQSGAAKTFYSINGSEYVEGVTFTVNKEGINQVAFHSIDAAGNVEAAKTLEVKIDKTAPVITMDLNGEYKLGTSLQLTYSAADDLSGVVSGKMVVFGPNATSGSEFANGSALTLDKPGTYSLTINATNAAGLTTTIEKQIVVYIPATIEVTPKVINGNKGEFTVRASLSEPFNSQGFDLNTATLNGVKALTSNKGYYNQAKLGQFKFERSDFTWTPSEVFLEFRCTVDGYLVVGSTTVKVQK